jgi:EspG family
MTLDWSRATVLTAAAFEACWEILQLGETPWQLEPPRQGSTALARRTFVAEVLTRLLSAGPELAEKLRLLARPEWMVDVRLRADRLIAGLAACRGADGVFAVRCGEEIALIEIRAANALATVVNLLGPLHPGPGPPVLIGTYPHPVTGAVAVACRDVRMFAQLGVSVTADDGHRVRQAPRVIGFHRTGDYRSVRVDPATVAVKPATLSRLMADVDELLTADRAGYSGFAGRGSM